MRLSASRLLSAPSVTNLREKPLDLLLSLSSQFFSAFCWRSRRWNLPAVHLPCFPSVESVLRLEALSRQAFLTRAHKSTTPSISVNVCGRPGTLPMPKCTETPSGGGHDGGAAPWSRGQPSVSRCSNLRVEVEPAASLGSRGRRARRPIRWPWSPMLEAGRARHRGAADLHREELRRGLWP